MRGIFLHTHGHDKGYSHGHTNTSDLVQLMAGFGLLSLTDNGHQRLEFWHWRFVAEAV